MQTPRTYSAINGTMRLGMLALLAQFGLLGCVSHVYQPGSAENPFNQLKLGQSYGDMVRILGKPDHSRTEDRMGQETVTLFIPGWNIVESIGDFNPSMLQIYTYDQWGTVTADNNNHIISIEAKEKTGVREH